MFSESCDSLFPSVDQGSDAHHTGHVEGVFAPFIERTVLVPLLASVRGCLGGFTARGEFGSRLHRGKQCHQASGVDGMTGPFTDGALVRLFGHSSGATKPSTQGQHTSNVQDVSPRFVDGALRLLVVLGFLVVTHVDRWLVMCASRIVTQFSAFTKSAKSTRYRL